jgi:hypothetical protein
MSPRQQKRCSANICWPFSLLLPAFFVSKLNTALSKMLFVFFLFCLWAYFAMAISFDLVTLASKEEVRAELKLSVPQLLWHLSSNTTQNETDQTNQTSEKTMHMIEDGKADTFADKNITKTYVYTSTKTYVMGEGQGGIILTAYFYFATDPRHKRHPKKKSNSETLYHIRTSAIHYGLRLIVFHDRHAFDQDFVAKYTLAPYFTFVEVEPPALADGIQESSPNDFRYGMFNQYLKEHPNEYKWYLIADRDMIFNRDPFAKLDYYQETYSQDFFGSYDGGTWNQLAQGIQFPSCFGKEFSSTFRPEVEWKTPNGKCGLWAGTYKRVQCVMECMANEYSKSPVKGKGVDLPCDMAVHDYCVFYGGCFPNTTKGEYNTILPGVRWGPDTHGEDEDLFGPSYTSIRSGRHTSCIKDSWTAVHYRCGNKRKPPICFNHSTFRGDGPLVKYYQEGHNGGILCNLDKQTDLPLPNKNQTDLPRNKKKYRNKKK